LRLKIAKFSRRQFSTQLADGTVGNEVSSACESSAEKNSSSPSQLTADSASGTVQEQLVRKQEDSVSEHVPVSRLSNNDNQLTGSLKSSKQIVRSFSKSASEENSPAVNLEQNLHGQLNKKSITERKEDVDNCTMPHRGSVVTKDSRKSDGVMSKSGTKQSHRHRRSSSDGSSSRQHHHRHRHYSHHLQGKPSAEQMSRNGEQFVPPLKIRVDHQSKNRPVDPQSAAATYSVDGRGSESVADDSDVVHKTSDTKNSEAVVVSGPTMQVADNKTEKNVVPPDRDVSKKDDTHVASDKRRTRNTSATRPVPIVRKRRLTFEESLIAGTCISTTSSPAVTTDVVKTSTVMPSGAVRSLEDTAQTVAQLTADSKAVPVPKPSEKKEFLSNGTKKIKLEDEKSVPIQHVSSTKTTPDEVKITQRSSDTVNHVNEGSRHAKSSSNVISVHAESRPSRSAALQCEIKCDSKYDQITDDSKSSYMKSDGTDLVIPKNEVDTKNSLIGASLVTAAEEAPLKPAKQTSSDRTSRHNHHQHHHHHDRHHRRHSSCSTKPHRMSGSHMDYELRQRRHNDSKYGSLMHIETDPNGGACVLHAFEDELSTLSSRELSEFVQEFFRVVFDEDPVGVPRYVIGIVHNSAAFLPDILEYFASAHPDMIVKRNILGKSSDVETTTVGEYYQRVQSTYLAGTYRTGALDHFSIVGTKAEETGGYFPEFLNLLDQNEFLKNVSPWGKLSELENMPRNESNDGPIVWARPGEQVVPTADLPKSPMVKKR